MGDGTFGFHAVRARHGAALSRPPIVVVVGNDARWNAEHTLQLRHYGAERTVGCELLPSRYDRIAEALGGHGELVERPDELEPALARALALGPARRRQRGDRGGCPAPTFGARPATDGRGPSG